MLVRITKGEAYHCFKGVKLPITVPVKSVLGGIVKVRTSDLYNAGIPFGSMTAYELSFVLGHDCELLEMTNQERTARRDLLRDRKRALQAELADIESELKELER